MMRLVWMTMASVTFAVTICCASEQKAAAGLAEAAAICQADHGILWGTSLCGPILLVDPSSRALFANKADSEGRLHENNGIFEGTLPPEINIANTALIWSGTKWTMIMLPLPEKKERRAALLAHEMWHRIQEQLGFPLANPPNTHLDTRDGRFWLQLEWRALTAALRSHGDDVTRAVTDALLFREWRRQLLPNAASEERALEMNEGLAEYTGVRLSGTPDLRAYVVEEELKPAASKPTFVRSFAYATGPAYGLLLDEANRDWRKKLRSTDDLAGLLASYRGIVLPNDLRKSAEECAAAYDGDALAKGEDAREQRRVETEKLFRARLIEGPVLQIPLHQMSMQFDPGNLFPIEGYGMVYPNIRIVDAWGILDVAQNGALLAGDFKTINIAAPNPPARGPRITGDGWTLNLKPGWTLGPGQRAGDYIVGREQ